MLSIFGAAQDSIDPIESATNKVKLSGRQAMLTQRISKAMCFVYLGHNSDDNLLKAAQASALFDETLGALRSGSVQKAVKKEEDPDILKELDRLAELWRPFKNTVNSILTSRTLTEDNLIALQTASADLEVSATRAADLTEQVYGSSDLGEAEATTLRFAGRQRQLVERATKHFCLTLAQVEKEQNLTALEETRATFFNSVFNLTFGNEDLNVLPSQSYELDLLFQGQFAAWFLLEDIFDAQLLLDTPLPEQLTLIEKVTDNLVETSEYALTLY